MAQTYLGTPCQRAGHRERFILSGACAICSKDYQAVYRAKHKAEKLAYNRSYYSKNKDRIYQQTRQYAKKHPEQHAAAIRKWRLNNLDHFRSVQKKWESENKHKRKAIHQARMARKRNAPGRYTDKDLAIIFKAQNGRCQYCCRLLGETWDADHVVPLANGGTNHPANIRIACMPCNRGKQDFSAEHFAGRMLWMQ